MRPLSAENHVPLDRRAPASHQRGVSSSAGSARLKEISGINAAESGPVQIRPLFLADWQSALFIHFRVNAAALQSQVPLELDLFDGHAYISLVAFTQRRLRPALGGRVAEWLSAPLATHDFLNVRTYVRHRKECGIFFLSEWIPNRLAVFLGPLLYGLPYRQGDLKYSSSLQGQLIREVKCAAGRLVCRATVDPSASYHDSPLGSEAHFLLERYAAFTFRHDVLRRFRIRHEPWPQTPAKVTFAPLDLLKGFIHGDPCSAHFSTGVNDVAIGRPERIQFSD